MAIIPNVIDLYHANPLNFSQVVAAGIWGIIHKARQGTGYGDPGYTSRMKAAKEAGLLWAGYDFATADNVANNVADFLAFANLGPNDGAWLDYEDNSASNMSATQAYEFLDGVNQKLGRACGIYGGNRIREQIDAQDPKWIDMAKITPLWQCRYIRLQPGDNEELFKTITPIPPWTSNFLIQYTGDGIGPLPHTVSGVENGADLDVFNGTKTQLASVWAGKSTTIVANTK